VRRFFAPHLPAAGAFRLEGEEASHLVRVLRARAGDEVRVFDGRGREAVCRVTDATKEAAQLEVVTEVDAPRARRDVLVLTAVPRGERMEWLVEKCVEAGASGIVGVAAARSVRERVGESNLRRWRRAAVEAAKQCGRADVPAVDGIVTIEDGIARAKGRAIYVAAPGAERTLDDSLGPSDRIALFIGPEGGFEAAESEQIAAAGARAFTLGPRILRIETAAAIATWLAAR
jgi:16S rRNA (uracil1498-N3)-methyltransferase